MTEKFGAVLTGDILHSMKFSLEMRSAIRTELDSIIHQLKQFSIYQGVLPHDLIQFRGDGWQLLVTDPALSLRACLSIRALLQNRFPKEKVDTRICIGLGTIPTTNEKFAKNDGEAFILSGRGLDAIPKRGGSNLMVKISPAIAQSVAKELAINPMLNAIDYIVERWTTKQAEVINSMLIGTLFTSDRVTRYALERAGWRVVLNILDYYEHQIGSL